MDKIQLIIMGFIMTDITLKLISSCLKSLSEIEDILTKKKRGGASKSIRLDAHTELKSSELIKIIEAIKK